MVSKAKKNKKNIVRAEGVDMKMLLDNLKRSYGERIRRHQIALATMEKLQKAKKL